MIKPKKLLLITCIHDIEGCTNVYVMDILFIDEEKQTSIFVATLLKYSKTINLCGDIMGNVISEGYWHISNECTLMFFCGRIKLY